MADPEVSDCQMLSRTKKYGISAFTEKKIKCLRFLENFLDSYKVLTIVVILMIFFDFFRFFCGKKFGFAIVVNYVQTGLRSREDIKMKLRINTF